MSYSKLTVEEILACEDRKVEDVNIPEWGGSFKLKAMSGAQREELERAYIDKTLKNFRARLVAYCLCREDGSLVFSEDQVTKLSEKSGAILLRVSEAANKVSGLSTEEITELTEKS